MKFTLFLFLLAILNGSDKTNAQVSNSNESAIKPYYKNPWYWEYKQKPVLLIGGSENDNLWQWDASKITEHLDLLVSVGGNYVRHTMADHDEGDTYAYKEVRAGVYDVSQWNDKYWEKLQFFLEETKKRDIIVQLTVWDWFDLVGRHFETHPLNPANNINWEKGVITESRDYYGGSVKNNNSELLKVQKRYVDKLLSVTFQYGHVLYNISNESSTIFEWEKYWAEYLNKKAGEYDREIYITIMQLQPEIGLRHVLSNLDIYSYAELSQNSQDSRGARGRAHWENVIRYRNIIAIQGPMPMNNVKIYGSGDGRRYGAGTGREAEDRMWKNIFAGAASARFHRSEGNWGIGLSERAQINIKAMTLFLKDFDIFSAAPYEEVKYIGSSEGYALANPGKEYAVYLPSGRHALELDLWVLNTKFSVKYLNIDAGTWSEEEVVELSWPDYDYMLQHDDLSLAFGYQNGILIKSPDNSPYVALVEVLE